MDAGAHTLLTPWANFYVIVGSAAAALTGLQFVVIVLIAQVRPNGSGNQIAAFGTPTVVHFAAALLLATLLSAPWQALGSVQIAIGAVGGAGLIYALLVVWRACRQTGYQLVLEDWLWHVALPPLAYAGVGATGLLLGRYRGDALFLVGAASVLLLCIGIHNAWDTVAYIADRQRQQ